MSKNNYDLINLKNFIFNCTKNYVEEIDPIQIDEVFNKALFNFEREVSVPFESFVKVPVEDSLKIQMVEILLKHFIIELKNKRIFDDDAFKLIVNEIESLHKQFK